MSVELPHPPQRLRGMTALLICSVVGAAIWHWAPFGAYGPGPVTRAGFANALPLGLAGLVALCVAYSPVRRVAVYPHGVASSTRIGGSWMPVAWLISALCCVLAFAWGPARADESVPLALGLWSSWAIAVEVVLRTRTVASGEGFTDPQVDALALNLEAAAAGVWISALIGVGLLLSKHPIDGAASLIATPAIGGVAVTYARAVAALAMRLKWQAWVAMIAMAVAVLGGRPVPGASGALLSALVALGCVALLEPARRAEIHRRLVQLTEGPDAEAARVRYRMTTQFPAIDGDRGKRGA